MRTDVTFINYDAKTDTVTMPRDVYDEIFQFCRQHGETDLPAFVPRQPSTVTIPTDPFEFSRPVDDDSDDLLPVEALPSVEEKSNGHRP
jgi:hypothetical protein